MQIDLFQLAAVHLTFCHLFDALPLPFVWSPQRFIICKSIGTIPKQTNEREIVAHLIMLEVSYLICDEWIVHTHFRWFHRKQTMRTRPCNCHTSHSALGIWLHHPLGVSRSSFARSAVICRLYGVARWRCPCRLFPLNVRVQASLIVHTRPGVLPSSVYTP